MTAELLPAYFWICRECGRENFGRMVRAANLAPEIAEEDPEGEWLLAPEYVKCDGCGTTFETETETLEDESDEPDDGWEEDPDFRGFENN